MDQVLSHFVYGIWMSCTLLHLHSPDNLSLWFPVSRVDTWTGPLSFFLLAAPLQPTQVEARPLWSIYLWCFITSVTLFYHLAQLVAWENVEIRVSGAWNMNVNSHRSLESTYLLLKSYTSLVEISFLDIALHRLIGTYPVSVWLSG